MSRQSGVQHHGHHPQHGGRHAPRTGAGYTLAHAGKQVRLGPVAFWIVVGSLVVMGAWTISTATYFAFRDDVLTRLIARQAEMQFAYEDRIAEMRTQVDRITSRQLLDQEQYEQKLEQVLRRQAALEARATALSALPDTAPTGSIRQPARATEPTLTQPKPAPINDTVIFVAPPDREARLESRVPASRVAAAKPATGGFAGVITRLQTSLDRVEARQSATLSSLEENYDSKTRRIRGVFADLGIDAKVPAPAPAPSRAAAVGGPFVPARPPADAGSFERQLYRISLARVQLDHLNRKLGAVPVRKPIVGEIETTSGFGVRVDPFVGRPAMHTGLDFRGSTGDPVRATATGTVETAGWSGGYGRMIEIDHGNGFSTRYGHLSAIDVTVGQSIKIGQVIGKIGSTGRSTGPHLHYETRVEGDAVDPQKFLRAGVRLGNLN